MIGEETSVQDNAVLHVTEQLPTVVGRGCTIGHLAHLEGCTVEDEALVGTGSIVLHEAVIGQRALVGAGAVVPGRMHVPAGSMALGMPAKIREGVDTDPLICLGWRRRSGVEQPSESRCDGSTEKFAEMT